MPPITRRNVLRLGGVGLAATATVIGRIGRIGRSGRIGRIGLSRRLPSRFDPVSAAALTERQALTTTAGLLSVRLAGNGPVPVAGRQATTVS